MHRDAVTESTQVVSGRHARGTRADDQNVFPGFDGRCRQLPATLEGLVAEKVLDRIDADRRIKLAAVAGALASVVTDPSHDRRERVVFRQMPPGVFVVTGFGVEEPALDILAGRALLVAGWQAVKIDRP